MTAIVMKDTSHPALRRLALLAVGKTGADIERIVRELRAQTRRRRSPLTWHDLEAALQAHAGPPRSPTLLRRVAVHEAGHAIAYTVLGTGIVGTVSIASADGGETIVRLDIGDLQSEAGIGRMMSCLLAGRAAERLLLGDAGPGSGGREESDLARATRLALDAETALGLSSDLPLLYRPPASAGDMLLYNDRLASRLHARLEAAETEAAVLIEKHRAALEEIARRLIERQVIDGDEVRAVIDRTAETPVAERHTENAIPDTG